MGNLSPAVASYTRPGSGVVMTAGGPAALSPYREFPTEWGYPPGRRYSEERSRWIHQHARRAADLKDPEHAVTESAGRLLTLMRYAEILARRDAPVTPDQRLADIERRRYGPA